MSMQIGQLTNSNLSGKKNILISDINVNSVVSTVSLGDSVDATGVYINFKDAQITKNDGFIVREGKTYYLKVSFYRLLGSSQNIKILLKSEESQDDIDKNVQNISNIFIERGDGVSEKTIVFKPIRDAKIIKFSMVRSWNDDYNQSLYKEKNTSFYLEKNDNNWYRIIEEGKDKTVVEEKDIEIEENTNGRPVLVRDVVLTELVNIGSGPYARIGLQAKPGFLFAINGYGIRVGRSGIYEPIVDYTINNIGIVNQDEPFILDYYKKND